MDRIKELISEMTLEEKASLCSGADNWHTKEIKRLNIPSVMMVDGPHGLRKQEGETDHLGLNESVKAVCFPAACATASSFDVDLMERMGETLGAECQAENVSILLGPAVNIKRSPLCGRNFEYFSEDPYLSGKMAASYVRGIQSNGISACPKHFAVNSQELRRMASDSVVDERTLRELYLTGFEIVVKEAKPKTIMSSYNLINGTYANENRHLLMDILRGEWDFDGAVVTDWGGSNDHALGVQNGSTLEMPAPGGDAVRELMQAVQSGKITEADVDARLDELLTLVFDTHAAVQSHSRTFDADAHHALARRAAAESIVLLKNENASIRLDFVSYEFPETEYGMDEYDKNWLQLRCTWVDEDGYTHKDSNACLLAQELAGMNAGLKVLAAGIKDRYDSDFISSDLSLFAWAEGELFRVYISFYLPNTMDGDDTAELNCTLTGPELKALIEDLDQACARFPERK